MDPARWQRIEHLCYAALEREPPNRAAFLDHACAGDPALRREIDELLHQVDTDPGFLEAPVASLASAVGDRVGHGEGDSIGPYRIVRRLGHGGMGDVYLALRTSEDISQQVALKVIRRGMATDDVLRRFRLERRILASLEHPNIARLLDAAATDDGRPYFVMEFVEGRPLTAYCDDHSLDVEARLRLFLIICAAVQHAHQNLVVHRDLKPSNILVTSDGVPKLLDFGIGKVLAPIDDTDPVATATGMRMLTPEYAAPEQITGTAITTATDVHGLGLLLFRVLTGGHPLLRGGETRLEMERAILEAVPTKPSDTAEAKIRRQLDGDLDNIVLKALRKEPERRYPSAAALGDDIRRHLDGLPVSARPDTIGYRTRKFVRRNVAAVTVTAVVALALVATTAVSLVQSRRVADEAARVTRERDKAVEVRGFLMEMFGASGADQAVGDTVTARRLLDLQAARLDSYRDRPELRAEMTEVLADGYDRLGLYAAAEPLARRATDLNDSVLGPDHPAGAGALNLLGWITHERGRSAEAVPLLERAVVIRRAAGENARADLSRSLNDLGVVFDALGRHGEARTVLTEALTIRRALFGDTHRTVGITANNLAAAHYFEKRLDSAVVVQDLAVRALRESVGPDHQRTVVALGNLAAFKRATGDWRAAEADYRDLLTRQTRLQGADHPVTARVRSSLATVLVDRGITTKDDSALVEAEMHFRGAIASFEARLGPGHPQVGTTLDRLAGALLARGDTAAAMPIEERAVGILRAALGDTSAAVTKIADRLTQLRARRPTS